ncbi:hypothetical protein LSCM1_02241 [Leishmania martiniquensis]|uniref:Endonuclease/exonuclease/phosphatase domain-containing protein n=1 Tax=Leishmania martiniquensis TaxID=1580590 RepID=A0A836KJR8_9TRYP|nr:hypothetical protein LSCM1_02241 [Leishmania martiniquensis]
MLRWLPVHRFRPFVSPLATICAASVDDSTSHVGAPQRDDAAESTSATEPTSARRPAAEISASAAPTSFLTDYRTEKALRRWSKTNRATQTAVPASSRTSPSPSCATAPSTLATSSTSSSTAARSLLRRTMQAKNRVVVLHPEGSQVVTLDLCIELPAREEKESTPPAKARESLSSSAEATAPSEPNCGATAVSKSMARADREAASKTLNRLRLLFAPPRPSEKSSKRLSKEQIFTGCPTVRAFCRSSDLAGAAEEGVLAAPEAKVLLFTYSNGTAPYTELNPNLPNGVFWRYAQILCVNETAVQVLHNVPTVTAITSPGTPYVGLPLVCANVSLLFASEESLCFEWCVLSKAPASTRSTGHNEAPFRVVGTGSTFTPTSDLEGKAMMLRVSLDSTTGLWTEMRLPGVVRQLPPPVSRWQETATAVNYPAFRVVTYNILYDDFCTSKSSKTKIYPFATDEILDLENRKVRIVQELLAYHADLLCLQECGLKVFEAYLLPVMRACGYEGVYFNKAGSVKEGCGFLFRTSRFKLVQSASVPLNFETLTTMFPELGARVGACPELKEALSAVTSIGARVLLRETTSDKEVVVGNTHLFYHANACHIRVLQAYMLLHWLNNAALTLPGDEAASPLRPTFADGTPPRRPLVICGDFNCTHPTGAYRLLTTGQVEADDPSWEKGKIFWWGCGRMLGCDPEQLEELLGEDTVLPQATAARKHLTRTCESCAETPKETMSPPEEVAGEARTEGPVEGGEQERVIEKVFREALYGPQLRLQDAYQCTDLSLPWTNFTLTFREVIDYIFFSEDSLEVLRTVPIPPESELAENFALPNKKYPSDHIALVADLALTTP